MSITCTDTYMNEVFLSVRHFPTFSKEKKKKRTNIFGPFLFLFFLFKPLMRICSEVLEADILILHTVCMYMYWYVHEWKGHEINL